ncbi:MAG: acyltransferase [Candidatus Helarchaeota archaeon]
MSKRDRIHEKRAEILRRKRSKLGHLLSRFVNIISSFIPGGGLRARLNRARGVRIGKNVWLGRNVYIEDQYPSQVIIEDGVQIAAYTIIVAHGKEIMRMKPGQYPTESPMFPRPTIIKKGAWIGIRSTILGGIIIGEGAVVASGSVVSKNVPDFTMVAGNPARIVAKLPKPPDFKPHPPYVKEPKMLKRRPKSAAD